MTPLHPMRARLQPEVLLEQFQFTNDTTLEGHVLGMPEQENPYATVVDVKEGPVIPVAGKLETSQVIRVHDPYVHADTEAQDRTDRYFAMMEEIMVEVYGFDPLSQRGQNHPYASDRSEAGRVIGVTDFTLAWLGQKENESSRYWRTGVPSAAALWPLVRPHESGLVTATADFPIFNIQAGDRTKLNATTLANYRHLHDGIGIRERASAMTHLTIEHVETMLREGVLKPGEPLRILDVGCGTAQPILSAAKQIMDTLGVPISIVATDSDADTLELVQGMVEKVGYKGEIKTVKAKIHDKKDLQQLYRTVKDLTSHADFHVIENLGFLEYLPERDLEDGLGKDGIGAWNGRLPLPNASEFLSAAYDNLVEGGILVSGNMRVNRPQIQSVFGIIGWPLINARSDADNSRIWQRANLRAAEVRAYEVQDVYTELSVYNIFTAVKGANAS